MEADRMNELVDAQMAGAQLTAAPLSAGLFWSWIVPALLFGIAAGATWLLYRHFADHNDE
jgi:hypothetical protein